MKFVPTRYAYAVRCSLTGEWRGSQRFNYHQGKHTVYTPDPGAARLYNRRCDAVAACAEKDEVVTFSLVEAREEAE